MKATAQSATAVLEKRFAFDENIIVLVAAAMLLAGAVLWADKPPTMERTDFSVTYIGSRMVYLGMGAKLYDLDEQLKLKKSILKDAEPLIYEHPPFEALLLAPLGALPYKTAYLVWGLINVAVWLILPYLVRPYAPRPHDNLAYVVLWFLFAPLGIALFQGQSSLLLLLLFTVAFIQLKQGDEQRAGLWLGVGLFKFQFVLPLALIFLLRRRWRFVRGFAWSLALLSILSVVAVGWRGALSYIRLLSAIGSHPTNVSFGSASDMATLQGFVHVLSGNSANGLTVRAVVVAGSALVICITAWYWKQIEGETRGFDAMFAAAIVVSLITGFHMFAHDLSPLLLSMFLAMAQIRQQPTRIRALLWPMLVLFWFPPIYFFLIARHCMYLMFPVLVAFWGLMLWIAHNSTTGGFSVRSLSADASC